MKVITKIVQLRSSKENDIIDFTEQTSEALKESKLENGLVTVFVQYHHDDTWHDGNGHSHVRASLIGPSLSIPFSNGQLNLGTWQQIVMLELDTRQRERVITLQILGE